MKESAVSSRMSDRQATPFMMCGYQHLKAPQTDERLLKQAHGAMPVSKARSGSAGKELTNLDVGVLKLSLGRIDRTTATSKGFAHVGSAGMIDNPKGEKLGIEWEEVCGSPENYGAGKPPAQAQPAGKKRSKKDTSLTRSVKNFFKRGVNRSMKKSGSEENEDTANNYVDQSMMSADLSERNCRNGHNKPDLPAGDGRRLAPRALSQSGPHKHMASNECLSYEEDPFNTSTLKVFRGARDDGNLYDSGTDIYETYALPMEPAAAPDGSGNRPSEPQSRSDVDEDAVYDVPLDHSRSSYEPLALPQQHPGTLSPQKTLAPVPTARSSGPRQRPNYEFFMPPAGGDLPGSSDDLEHHADSGGDEYDDIYQKIPDVDNDLCTDGACSDAQSTNSDDETDYHNYPAVLHAAEKESTTRPIYARSAKKSRDREFPLHNAGEVSISPEPVPVGVSPVTRSRPTPAPRTSIKKCPPRELPEVQKYLDEFRKLSRASGEDGATEKAVCNLDFAVRMLDKKGGRLQLVSHGVTLDVPPGALGDLPREVYVYVQRTSQPSLARDSAFVTPVVHCGCSGLQFHLPVVLTFPVHVKDPSQWELSGVRQDSSTTPWKELSESCDSLVMVKDGLCTIITNHFTGFGVAVRPKEPRGASGSAGKTQGDLPLIVGVYRSEEISGHLQLRVRIWDDSERTRQHIDREEIHGKLLDTTRKLFLRMPGGGGARHRDPGLDLVVVISKLNPQWKTEDPPQVIDLARLQPDRSGRVDVSCTFNLQLRRYGASPLPYDGGGGGPGMYLLNCDLDIGQRSHQQLSVTIRALDEIAIRTGSRDSSRQSLRSMHMGEGCPNPMSPEGYGELCRYLDGELRWKNLADHFLGGSGTGAVLENCYCPSETLLHLIFSRTSTEGAVITLDRLGCMLRDCGLRGAADIVLKEMGAMLGGRSGWSKVGSGALLKHLEYAHLKVPINCTDDNSRRPHIFDQEEIIYEVPTTLKTTDAAIASGGKEPEENDEDPDRVHTLRSILLPHQAEAPSHLTRRRQEPTEQVWPTESTRHESRQSPIDRSNPEQSNQTYSEVTFATEGNTEDFEREDSSHYENFKVVRSWQSPEISLPEGYVKKCQSKKLHQQERYYSEQQ